MERALNISKATGLQVHSAMQKGFINPYWIISTENKVRLEHLKVNLKNFGIEYRMWWGEGLHQQPSLTPILSTQEFPICDHIVNHSLALPFYEDLSDEGFNHIKDALMQI
jgi:dTDP-4-amino-4,6-dideoxygalactose transaminase